MNTSAYLVAAFVFAVPSSALTNAPESLMALRGIQSFGLFGAEYSRFFDAAVHKPILNLPAISAKPGPQPAPEPLRKSPQSTAPFALRIPTVPPPPYERTFGLLEARKETHGYDELILSYAEKFGLDPRLIKSVIAAESEFATRAKSPAGALGLMQVMPATAGGMGISKKDLFKPEANIRAGTTYLAHLFERAWKRYNLKGVAYRLAPAWLIQRIVAAYNAGPRFLARRKLYRETREYVTKVLLFYQSKVTELRPTAFHRMSVDAASLASAPTTRLRRRAQIDGAAGRALLGPQ
jgi:soluble lytic murein transglycosylase-like protein